MSDKRRLFDFDKLNLLLLSPAPLDLLTGLVLEDSFVSVKKESKNIGYKKGLGGEVLVSELFDSIHLLELKYLPNSPIVYKLHSLKILKTQFGITIQNNSAPKYKGVASECRFLENPGLQIGTSGFNDLELTILMTDYVDVFLPN